MIVVLFAKIAAKKLSRLAHHREITALFVFAQFTLT